MFDCCFYIKLKFQSNIRVEITKYLIRSHNWLIVRGKIKYIGPTKCRKLVQNSLFKECKALLSCMYHVLLRDVSKTLLSSSFASGGTTRSTAPTRSAWTVWCCDAASAFSWRSSPHGRSDRIPTRCSWPWRSVCLCVKLQSNYDLFEISVYGLST